MSEIINFRDREQKLLYGLRRAHRLRLGLSLSGWLLSGVLLLRLLA